MHQSPRQQSYGLSKETSISEELNGHLSIHLLLFTEAASLRMEILCPSVPGKCFLSWEYSTIQGNPGLLRIKLGSSSAQGQDTPMVRYFTTYAQMPLITISES